MRRCSRSPGSNGSAAPTPRPRSSTSTVSCPRSGRARSGSKPAPTTDRTRDLVAAIDHPDTLTAIGAERAFLAVLDGSCRTPIAGHARIAAGAVAFRGLILRPDGSEALETVTHRCGRRRGPTRRRCRAGIEEPGRAGFLCRRLSPCASSSPGRNRKARGPRRGCAPVATRLAGCRCCGSSRSTDADLRRRPVGGRRVHQRQCGARRRRPSPVRRACRPARLCRRGAHPGGGHGGRVCRRGFGGGRRR